MQHVRQNRLRYALSFSVLVLLVCAIFAMQPNDPGAIAQQKMVPAPLTDNDWDFWSNSPDMSSVPSGNVGIGTSTPAAKLDVDGDLQVSDQIVSTLATGTAPLSVSSTTKCTNLNVDMLDGLSAGEMARRTTTFLPSGGNTKSVSIPHYQPFEIMVADQFASPDQLCFIHCVENDHQLIYVGLDSSGSTITGSVSLWTSDNVLSLCGGDITLNAPGDGSYSLVFSAAYQDCKCVVTW